MLYFSYYRLQTIAEIKTNLISTSCSLLWRGSMFALGLSRCCTSSNIIAAIIITTGNYLNVFGKHRCWGKQNKWSYWSLLQCQCSFLHMQSLRVWWCHFHAVQWCKVVFKLTIKMSPYWIYHTYEPLKSGLHVSRTLMKE